MNPSTRYAFLALALFLVLVPLAAGRPGLPPTMKADEPAYFLMAESLARDFDLRCERRDIDRAVNAFPYAPIHNLILMSSDGWETVYFGKPYVYSLFAAPLVALFGFNGMLATNLLLVALMIWCGARYLRRFNSDAMALLFSAAFFLLGPSFVYAFWAHPEVFNMAAVTLCLYFVFGRERAGAAGESAPAAGSSRSGLNGLWAPLASGAALAFGAYNKPVLAALALPVVVALWRQKGLRAVVAWGLAGLLAGGALAGISWGLTGTGSAYLGVARTGIHIHTTEDLDQQVAKATVSTARRHNANSWQWIVQRPDFDPPEFFENLGYLLIGKHTGLVPYMPLAVLCFVLFLWRGVRSVNRWLLVLAVATVAVFFLIAIPINWHGGGGFVGNRYLAILYPAFLFLVTSVTPAWAPLAGIAAAALLLGPMLLTPYGAPVAHPTLQAHVRSPIFRLFPLELTLRERIPGYAEAGYGKILFVARRDVMRVSEGRMEVQAATPVEFWILGPQPVDSFLFEIRSRVPDNRVRIKLGDARVEEHFTPVRKGRWQTRTVELAPGPPARTSWFKPVRYKRGNTAYSYKMVVETSLGEVPEGDIRRGAAWMLVGAEINYLGTREQVSRPEHYGIAWEGVEAPSRVETGAKFTARARVVNRGENAWEANGALPIRLGYHWLDSAGRTVEIEGRRSHLPSDVAPGEAVEAEMAIVAPRTAGRYTLVLDAIREPIAWFSARGGATGDVAVEVSPPQ
jgi:hypothetical protein